MKRCPQCNSVFEDSLVYCTNDGTPLLEETFVLPSESSPLDAEEITVIHHAPITIDIPNTPALAPTEAFNYQIPPATNVVPVVIEKRRNTGRYLLFLFIGLILGGGLVLAAVLFGIFLYQNKSAQTANTANRNSQVNSVQTTKTSPTETPKTVSAKHEKHTDAPDDEFNGRVITLNAYVRSSPNRNSKEIDILPVDDRLNIAERENENSPWYHITCEHGTTGWMHGNTIEFTR
ncbi:MAG: SH3 domain-containing protein [Actinomycetota bacterium]